MDAKILDWLKGALAEAEGWDSKEAILDSWLNEREWLVPGIRGVDGPIDAPAPTLIIPTPILSDADRAYVLAD